MANLGFVFIAADASRRLRNGYSRCLDEAGNKTVAENIGTFDMECRICLKKEALMPILGH
jgi:hypothetical protein